MRHAPTGVKLDESRARAEAIEVERIDDEAGIFLEECRDLRASRNAAFMLA